MRAAPHPAPTPTPTPTPTPKPKPRLALALLLGLGLGVGSGSAFELDLGPPKDKRCVREQINEGTTGTLLFAMTRARSPESEVLVTVNKKSGEPPILFKETLHEKEAPQHKYALDKGLTGQINICFQSSGGQGARVSMEMEPGEDPELHKIEEQYKEAKKLLISASNEMDYMLRREMHLRQTSDSTQSRVELFGTLSILVLVAVSFYQVIYLRWFFQSKKLL